MTNSNSDSDDDRVVFNAPTPQCAECLHWRIRLFPPKIIEGSDKISNVLAFENITKIFCRKNRIVYRDGGEPKSYSSKHALSEAAVADTGKECPDFEEW